MRIFAIALFTGTFILGNFAEAGARSVININACGHLSKCKHDKDSYEVAFETMMQGYATDFVGGVEVISNNEVDQNLLKWTE